MLSKIEKYNPNKLLLRIPVPWVFVLIYLIGVLLHSLFPLTSFSKETVFAMRIFGIILLALGVIIASWSLFIFRKARTTTTPGKVSAELIARGPYRITRNPMYISLILAYIGEAGILHQIWPVILIPFLFAYLHWVVIPLEEKILTRDFKKMYKNYCNRVHRWL